ncbi:MAG: phosphopyruvate hydratase, partial [Chloroflexota bacterium]
MSRITSLSAIEILDSRGRPTVKAYCTLASGARAEAAVPSGASTGTAEALELRDGDPQRYHGLGCRKAVENVKTVIRDALVGKDFDTQAALDTALIELDGTPNKAKLGANAILAVSLAFARAQANESGVPLYQHFAAMNNNSMPLLPHLTVNLFSGGKHAGGQVPIQDVLLVPHSRSVDDALATTYNVYQAAVKLISEKYGMRPLKADEGGLAPPFPDVESMLSDAVEAIKRAGYTPGQEVSLAVDVASSQFYSDGRYHINNQALDSSGMVNLLLDWIARFPIISVEDGLAEEDWGGWGKFYRAAYDKVMIIGDDLLCTNPRRIRIAIDYHAANSLLLKVNQIGTLTEALQSYQLARDAGWQVVVSARSGETEDSWLADLATGWAGDYIKVGSIMQSERLAKYNRLLEIETVDGLTIHTYDSMPIEDLHVSADSVAALKSYGISTVGEIVELLEQNLRGNFAMDGIGRGILDHLDVILVQLKAKGIWPEN